MYNHLRGTPTTFSCECGHTLTLPCGPENGGYCFECGRFYSVSLTEHLHDRIWLDDKVNAIDMMPIPQELKDDIKQYAKKVIMEAKTK